MISLVSANWLLFLIALLIGVATAFWAWAASGRESLSDGFDGDDGLLEKAGEAVPPASQPVAPEPEPVKPVVVAPTPKPAPKPTPKPKSKPTPVPKAAPAPSPTPRPRKKAAPAAAPVAAPAGKPKISAAVGDPDNLRLIKGVGPKLNTLLNNLEITRFDQIAEWKEAEIQEVDQYLETFSGRITRDAWIDQAKYLAKDDIAGFEKKYGKL